MKVSARRGGRILESVGSHVDVEKGQDADLGVRVPAHATDVGLECLQRVGDDVVVREHDALGQTRRALEGPASACRGPELLLSRGRLTEL